MTAQSLCRSVDHLGLGLNLWYLDDGSLAGSLESLGLAVSALESMGARRLRSKDSTE